MGTLPGFALLLPASHEARWVASQVTVGSAELGAVARGGLS